MNARPESRGPTTSRVLDPPPPGVRTGNTPGRHQPPATPHGILALALPPVLVVLVLLRGGGGVGPGRAQRQANIDEGVVEVLPGATATRNARRLPQEGIAAEDVSAVAYRIPQSGRRVFPAHRAVDGVLGLVARLLGRRRSSAAPAASSSFGSSSVFFFFFFFCIFIFLPERGGEEARPSSSLLPPPSYWPPPPRSLPMAPVVDDDDDHARRSLRRCGDNGEGGVVAVAVDDVPRHMTHIERQQR